MRRILPFILQPGKLQLAVAIFLILFFSFYVKQGVCAASLFFAYCVSEHGFPFVDMISGETDAVPGELLSQEFQGQFFFETGGVLFNPFVFLFNAGIYYLIAAVVFFIAKQGKKKKSVT